MAEAFKNLLNATVVRTTARHLRRAWPDFDARAFELGSLTGLDALETKARAMHIAGALEATLPTNSTTSAHRLTEEGVGRRELAAGCDPAFELVAAAEARGRLPRAPREGERRDHAGRHGVDLRVNGEVVATAGFDLRL